MEIGQITFLNLKPRVLHIFLKWRFVHIYSPQIESAACVALLCSLGDSIPAVGTVVGPHWHMHVTTQAFLVPRFIM